MRQSITSLKEEKTNKEQDGIWPQVKFVHCPVRTSLGVLGKKWTMLILRDIGFLKIVRFNRILDSISGLTPRVLSMRLRELEDEGYIECVGGKKEPLFVVWRLTEKGRDTLPILIHITAFGSKWHADVVFEDKKPRSLNEIFPQPEVSRIMMGIR